MRPSKIKPLCEEKLLERAPVLPPFLFSQQVYDLWGQILLKKIELIKKRVEQKVVFT